MNRNTKPRAQGSLKDMRETTGLILRHLARFQRTSTAFLEDKEVAPALRASVAEICENTRDDIATFRAFSRKFLPAAHTARHEEKTGLMFSLRAAARKLLESYNLNACEQLADLAWETRDTPKAYDAINQLLEDFGTAAPHGHWLIATHPSLQRRLSSRSESGCGL